jgi:hypothetical protein
MYPCTMIPNQQVVLLFVLDAAYLVEKEQLYQFYCLIWND